MCKAFIEKQFSLYIFRALPVWHFGYKLAQRGVEQGLCSNGKATGPVRPVIYYHKKSNLAPASMMPPSPDSHAL